MKARELLYSAPPIRWLFEHSQAWNFVRNRLSSIVQKSLLRGQGLESFSTDKPEAVALTKALLRQFLQDIQADEAEPIIVIIPNGGDLTSNFPMTLETVLDLGAGLIDGRVYLTKEDYFARDSHIRPIGHRKTATHLKELLVAPRTSS